MLSCLASPEAEAGVMSRVLKAFAFPIRARCDKISVVYAST